MGRLDNVAIGMAAAEKAVTMTSEMTIGYFAMNMKATSTLLMWGAILMLCFTFTPQEARAQSSPVSPLVDDPSPKQVQKPADAKPMNTNCYTNAENCAGYTTVGGFRYAVECSIWWNNGANGRSTMTFQAGQTHDYYVRYNDVGSCIGTQYGQPPNSPSFYLYVHSGQAAVQAGQ